MRPLRMEIKGFTAFRDEQTIDFEKDALDLFAIAGPTGSGKTSILDAMTYALFGEIERVGRQAGQFVSQGQTRMAVMLEFAVDGRRYRVTRSTPAKTGTTKILLERFDGADWVQAGEGADRVREANALIADAIGLTYEAFTRTVLLPQGRFAEFLVGDATERRKILTELLGLELFERLAKRAGEVKRDAAAAVEMHERLLATEYAGVTPDAVAEAERLAKEAAAREATLADAEAAVRDVAERWADTERTIRDLRTCSRDARDATSTAAEVAETLAAVVDRAAEAEAEVAVRAKASVAAEKDAAKATTAREKAEAAWGTRVDLERLLARAAALVGARDVLAAAEAEVADVRAAMPDVERVVAEAGAALAVATADAEAALAALDQAMRARDDAQHANLVAAVRRGVHVGEACPVCGTTIEALPKVARAMTLETAEVALETAKAQAASANAAVQAAHATVQAAEADVKAASKELVRAEKQAAKAKRDEAALVGVVRAVLGAKLPPDPIVAVEERIERLEGVLEEERVAHEAADDARDAVTRAERARDGLATEVAQGRGALEALAVGGLLERAAAVAGRGFSPPSLPSVRALATPSQLAAAAATIAHELATVAQDLDERADEAGAGEAAIFADAVALIGDAIEVRSRTMFDLVSEVAGAHTEAARVCSAAKHEAASLAEKLARSAELAESIGEHRARASVFGDLARELQQNRLIAFVQAEALQLLARAGSERLQGLSSGRYRLDYADDAFSVIDTWNGEERRSAKTLSGGETFLASLALALALSEQAPGLAVTSKARLDSLFLDEGFGTLDPETLEVVVDAIEQLGGDGRMVGVITHVQELAIRLPARIEVEKSPRGSMLRVVAEGDAVAAAAAG